MRGDGVPRVAIPAHTGDVVYVIADAVTNASTGPIEVIDLRPESSSVGLAFTGAFVEGSSVRQISWVGSVSEEATMVKAQDVVPFAVTPMAAGASADQWLLRFSVQAEPAPELTASGLRVTYRQDGQEWVEMLNQEVVVQAADRP